MARMSEDEEFVAAVKKVKSYTKYGAVGIIGLCAVLGSYFTVPQTELCYITQWGKVVDADKGPIGAGLHWKIPFLQGVDCLQVTRSTDQLGVVAVTTKDSFTFTMKVGVTTEIPSTAVYRLLYQTGGMGKGDIKANIDPNIINTLRDVIGKHELIAIAGEERMSIQGEFQKQIAEKLTREWGIIVDEVQVSIEKLPDLYVERMSQAQSQQAAIVVARREQEKQAIEAKTKVIAAEGEANRLAAEADGKRRADIAHAEGEAKSILLKAEANAEAARLQGEANAIAAKKMADALSANPNLVNLKIAERWQGNLPFNMYGSAPIPFINLPNPSNK